jgi:hypothetical protein
MVLAVADFAAAAAREDELRRVTQLSAAGVLVDMGAGGRAALVSALPEATEYRARSTIQDALREADDPARRPLGAYPLDERERKRIRGCGAAAH